MGARHRLSLHEPPQVIWSLLRRHQRAQLPIQRSGHIPAVPGIRQLMQPLSNINIQPEQRFRGNPLDTVCLVHPHTVDTPLP